ncbi:dolichol-phosphate mannosyltransferase subunit 3 [Cephus cinctus]|uniref:Dolichol-phosphate mannosyltransferase subunit 3 n=1 Tax=Cephus cinctus TaxID=211228 RepID=A0AAJ7C627_CEPCN|nr:dolichol-phosphate mannosyltransferase subunit 3 [Cephus cinctus]
MTKLMEWLLFATTFLAIWIAALTGNIHPSLVSEWRPLILLLPIISLFLFGLYAATVVMYRVFTFNNCEEAAIELQQQIKEAKAFLREKGITIKEN